MAENQERILPRDESGETGAMSERVEAPESVGESPEQKKAREYQENIARLEERAREYLETQKAQTSARGSAEPSALPLTELAPLPTMADAREQWEKNRGWKDGIKRFRLRLAGVERPDDVMALTAYFERNLKDEEHRYIRVSPARKEGEMEKYRRLGYEVSDDYSASDTEKYAMFLIEKEIPYRIAGKDKKRLAELLGQANDPIETIERLQRFGFSMKANTIKYHFDALRDFVSSSDIMETVATLEQADLRPRHASYFHYRSDEWDRMFSAADAIRDLARDPEKRAQLNDENLERIKELNAAGLRIFLDERWDDAMRVVKDRDATVCLAAMAQRMKPDRLSYDSDILLKEAIALQDAGLTQSLAPIIRASPWLGKELLRELSSRSYYQYSGAEREQKKIEDARALLALPVVQKMRVDPALAAFVEEAATLAGHAPSLKNAESYASLREYPEAIPLLELCRELGVSSIQHVAGGYAISDDIHAILVDQEMRIRENLLAPEFFEFASRIKEELGYQLRLEDFLSHMYMYSGARGGAYPGPIVQLFRDPLWPEGMASGRAPQLIKKFGKFLIGETRFYTNLLEIKNSVEVLNKLEQKFQIDFADMLKPNSIRLDTHNFRQLCEDERMQNELFDDRTVSFYQRLKNDFEYQFDYSNMGSLVTRSRDTELTALLADPQNQKLIKETFAHPEDLAHIALIKEIDEKFKPLVYILAREFHLRYGQSYGSGTQLSSLYEAREAVLPITRRFKELKIDFNIIRDIEHLKKAVDHNLSDLFERMKDQPALCAFILQHVNTLVKDDSDVRFIATIVGKHGKAGDAFIRDYARCLVAGAITTTDKQDVLEFGDAFRILSPAIITEYIAAKRAGTRDIFLTHLKAVAEKLTGSGTISPEEKERPYFQDLLREVYPNNSGNWTTYANNESCEDRSADLSLFRIRPRYEIDLLSVSEIKIKDGEALDMQAIEALKKEILSVAEKMQNLQYDSEKAKTAVNEELDGALREIVEQGGFQDIDLGRIASPEEKLFLIMTDASYGTRTMKPEYLRSFLIFYEFAYFEDIRDYMQGTSDRVSQATNPDYALLCELNTFFADRIKEVNRRVVEAGFSNETIRAAVPAYFKRISRETVEQERAEAMNRIQIDKLGLTDDFVRQIARTLRGRTGKNYTPEQIQRLIKHYESMTKGLPERVSVSPKQRTRALYGQLKSQRERTLQAIKIITGKELQPEEVYLGQMNIQEFLEAETNISEGAYDENQFASYTMQKFLNFFGEERDITERELNKFQSSEGTKREVLFGYMSKNKESAHARMVGGVCVCGDNPQKVGQECMWNMPNYFQLVLQNPGTYRCVGTVLLHHFTDQEGKRILTASLNPSSTYLYGTDEKALFGGLVDALEVFAGENHLDMILLPKNKQIRTNRTGGIFEREMDTLIAGVNKEYVFNEPKRFSYSPGYFMDKMDVIWER